MVRTASSASAAATTRRHDEAWQHAVVSAVVAVVSPVVPVVVVRLGRRWWRAGTSTCASAATIHERWHQRTELRRKGSLLLLLVARARLVAVWPVHTGGVAGAALLLLLHPARRVRLRSQTHLRAMVHVLLLVLVLVRPAVAAIVMMVVMMLLLAARTILPSSIQGGELVRTPL